MPLTSNTTVTTKVETITTQTIYPAYYIRSGDDLTAYLHHFDPEETDWKKVDLTSFQTAKAWKLDKDKVGSELSIVSAAGGFSISYENMKKDTLLDLDLVSTRKWKVEPAGTGRFRISGTFDIIGKYWTHVDDTVKLLPEDKNNPGSQEWVFEPILFV